MSDTREEFEAWKKARAYGEEGEEAAWQAASSARQAEIDRLREALTRLCTQFPTDADMAAAGWETHEINAACDAYDAARAALKGPQP